MKHEACMQIPVLITIYNYIVNYSIFYLKKARCKMMKDNQICIKKMTFVSYSPYLYELKDFYVE